jgi:folate-binding protein YgfZ
MLSPDPTTFKDGASSRSGALPGFSLLACTGPDAGAFLQAQAMNDVRALSPGHWQWNGWLNPKGRLICLFALWQRAEHDFLLLLPDFPAIELQPLLQRYVFRSKLRLAAEEAFEVRGDIGGEVAAGGRDEAVAEGASWRFDVGGEAGARCLRLVPSGDGEPGDGPGFADSWRALDLMHGLPRLDAEQREAWTPQMLSLQRLQAFSLSKGCYPGQEIVARTHYLGQAKRELALLEGEGLSAGAAVLDVGGGKLGTVVSSAHEGRLGLAVLPAGREGLVMSTESATVRELPLHAGLQRPA